MDPQQIAAVLLIMRYRKQPERKRLWMHAIQQGRNEYGEYHHLILRDLPADPKMFFQYFRMSIDKFDELLSIVGPSIKKEDTNWRQNICPRQRLSVCLR